MGEKKHLEHLSEMRDLRDLRDLKKVMVAAYCRGRPLCLSNPGGHREPPLPEDIGVNTPPSGNSSVAGYYAELFYTPHPAQGATLSRKGRG